MMERQIIRVIANPAAGRGRGERRARRLIQALKAAGYTLRVQWTRGRGHAESLARQAGQEGAATLVVCGGDGTVQEAARALAWGSCRLLPVASGRCNDFCRALGWSWGGRPELVAQALGQDRSRRVDLALVNGKLYCTVGAVGFDAVVSRYVDQMLLPLWGTPAYLYGVLRVLAGYQPAQVRLAWGGGLYEGPLFLAAVANTPTYGNGMPIVPLARPDDGLLDVCLIRPAGFWRVVGLLPAMLRGAHGRAPEVSFLRTRRVEINSESPLEIWADGEPMDATPLVIEAAPQALEVLLPPEI